MRIVFTICNHQIQKVIKEIKAATEAIADVKFKAESDHLSLKVEPSFSMAGEVSFSLS